MIKQLKLGDLVRDKILLRSTPSGWDVCKCPVCNDYKERGGFKIDPEVVGWSCFNCGSKALYEEGSGKISRGMRKVLTAFGIDDTEISSVVNTTFFKPKEDKTISLSSLTKVSTATPEVKLPPKSFLLGDDQFIEHQVPIVEYLLSRCINLDKYTFYFSLDQRHIDQVIIPYFRQGKLIYWQGRSIKPGKARYDNAPVGRDAVIFNMDQLYTYTPAPLFVTEGAFDAMPVDVIGLLGSKLSPAKVELLTQARRRLIFVIDKDKNGRGLAEDVLQRGWEITFAPEGASDLNRSVQRFGLSYTAYQLMKAIPKDADAARLSININCGSK